MLNPGQREAIRKIADEEDGDLTNRRIGQLKKLGLVKKSPRGGYILTDAGRREHKSIMSSGDGPEGLKELFRF